MDGVKRWCECERNEECGKVEETIVTKADIIVKGTADKPYFVIVYHEVGNDCDNDGFGSYNLKNVFEWREQYLEIVKE